MVPGLIADLDAAHPLDPHVAFPPWNDEADRIALFRAQRFAVHLEGDEAIVHRLFDRDRAGHGGGVGAFGHDPLAIRLDASGFEQIAQRHAGIHDVVDHAVGELAAVQLGAAPFHARVRRAF